MDQFAIRTSRRLRLYDCISSNIRLFIQSGLELSPMSACTVGIFSANSTLRPDMCKQPSKKEAALDGREEGQQRTLLHSLFPQTSHVAYVPQPLTI
jgi:hypothetical protein